MTCARARQAARRLLTEMDVSPERTDDVLTVISELVANACRHAGGVTGLRITPRPGGVVVEVSDSSPRLPREEPSHPARPGGFGWAIVNRLADSVTIRPCRSGKTITALLTTSRDRED